MAAAAPAAAVDSAALKPVVVLPNRHRLTLDPSSEAHKDLDVVVVLGEGALWDVASQTLYWIDIRGARLYAYRPDDNACCVGLLSGNIGTVVPRKSGGLVAAMHNGFVGLSLGNAPRASDVDKQAVASGCRFDVVKVIETPIIDPESAIPGNRFNDGKCDPQGRLWAGTMCMDESKGDGKGSLYVLNNDLSCTKRLSGLTVPNGIVWTRDGTRMYHIDSPARCVRAYSFDGSDGSITPATPEVCVRLPQDMMYPDGMTIDAADTLWIACWLGSCVARFDPRTGKLLAKIMLPVSKVTSCAFGGPALADLFITSASFEIDLEKEPLAGSVFVVRNVPAVLGNDARGVPAFAFADKAAAKAQQNGKQLAADASAATAAAAAAAAAPVAPGTAAT